MKKQLLVLILAAIAHQAVAQLPGTLDASFDGTGIKKFSFQKNSSDEMASASAKDASGNLYVVGSENSPTQLPFVIKVLPNGTLDPTFGNEGKARFDITPGSPFFPYAIAVAADGGIVLAGQHGTSEYYACAVKLTQKGVLDNNFSYGGYVDFNYGGIFNTVQITATGNIFASGSTSSATDPSADFLVVKMDTYGSADFKFGAYGAKTLDLSGFADVVNASFLDDTILYVAGTSRDNNSYVHYSIEAISTNSGLPVSSFASGSPLVLNTAGTTGSANTCTAIQVDKNHNIVLGGYVSYFGTSTSDFLVYKLTSAGNVDATFSASGYKTYQGGSAAQSQASSMLLDPVTNNIVMAGSVSNGSAYNWTVIRAKALGGALDNSFGTNGVQTFSLNTNSNGITGVVRLTDGSYVLTGSLLNTNNISDVLVKKINTSGVSTTAFGTNSELKVWMEDYDAIINDVALRASDGGFWVCGHYTDPVNGGQEAAVALLKSDGTPNPAFGGANGSDPGVVKLTALIPNLAQYPIDATAIEIQPNGKIVVAGNYFDNGFIYLMRFNVNGSLDTTFNATKTKGYKQLNSNSLNAAVVHDIALQTNGKILLYGYSNYQHTLIRFKSTGELDSLNFASKGIYSYPEVVSSVDQDMTKIQVKVQSDGKIVCVGNTFPTTTADFLVFRVDTTGVLDTSFGSSSNGIFTYDFALAGSLDDYATTLCIKSDGRILVGGYASNGNANGANYALLQLTSNGILDPSFGSSSTPGTITVNKGFEQQGLRDLYIEGSNAIVASGIAGSSKGDFFISALRFTAAGLLDPSFFSNAQNAKLTKGYARNARLYNGSLYIAGCNDKPDNSPLSGVIVKITLGAGPVVKTTNLQLSDLQKTFGDAPFLLKPITNSPAPVTYSLLSPKYTANCGSVDAKTGLVTVSCISNDPPLMIQAVQAAVPGYTADTASCTINVSQGIPTIVFNNQGGLVGETFAVSFQTNSTGSYEFSGGSSDIYFVSTDSIHINAVGSTEVSLYISSDYNKYANGYATAIITGYATPVPPVAADDRLDLTQSSDNEAIIYVLANDEAYTGQIDPKLVDLDPSTPGVQSTYLSPSLGGFFADSTGAVSYVPFEGFIGSGSIPYTITDTRGDVSQPANIKVSIKIVGAQPALKATELVTPNNDGLNDAFVIGYVDLTKQNQLKVFDRNGEELFTQSNYKNDWNGDLPNGKKAENGIYFYLFTEGNDGDERELKGTVELKR